MKRGREGAENPDQTIRLRCRLPSNLLSFYYLQYFENKQTNKQTKETQGGRPAAFVRDVHSETKHSEAFSRTHPVVVRHLPVLARASHLHRKEHPAPVPHAGVPDGQPEEVHTVVGIDAFGNALLGLTIALREQPRSPAVAIVKVLFIILTGETEDGIVETGTKKNAGGSGRVI